MRTLDATIASLIPDWPNVTAKQRADLTARCTTLVHQQIGVAPFYVRLGVAVLLAAFRCFALFKMGPNPSAPLRAQALAAFSALSLPMCANLERVLRSTTLLFYFEQSEVLAALGEQTISERQMAFRARRLETESMRDAG